MPKRRLSHKKTKPRDRATPEALKARQVAGKMGQGGGMIGLRKKYGTCDAPKKGGGKCQLPTGYGTPHIGIGKCKFHGGNTTNHIKSAAKEELRRLLGHPIEINPLDAILRCIALRNGEIEWLTLAMTELDEEDFIENTLAGKQFHLYARERQAAMSDLVRYSQIAISLGIAERAIKLAETYAELLATYTKGLLDDLWPHLDEVGRSRAPQLVRARLIALDGGMQGELPEHTAA